MVKVQVMVKPRDLERCPGRGSVKAQAVAEMVAVVAEEEMAAEMAAAEEVVMAGTAGAVDRTSSGRTRGTLDMQMYC